MPESFCAQQKDLRKHALSTLLKEQLTFCFSGPSTSCGASGFINLIWILVSPFLGMQLQDRVPDFLLRSGLPPGEDDFPPGQRPGLCHFQRPGVLIVQCGGARPGVKTFQAHRSGQGDVLLSTENARPMQPSSGPLRKTELLTRSLL
jgi:hypothetical protein